MRCFIQTDVELPPYALRAPNEGFNNAESWEDYKTETYRYMIPHADFNQLFSPFFTQFSEDYASLAETQAECVKTWHEQGCPSLEQLAQSNTVLLAEIVLHCGKEVLTALNPESHDGMAVYTVGSLDFAIFTKQYVSLSGQAISAEKKPKCSIEVY